MAAVSSMQDALALHSALVEECKHLQKNALQATQVDVMHVEMGKSEFRNRSTVGLQLDGCVVDNLVVGGPAFNCRQIHEGDTILKIDGKSVNDDNIMTCLVGPDLPGSAVTLTLNQKGVTKDVSLKRMDSVIISGKLKLFDHFTKIKEKALAHSKDVPELAGMVDQCIHAWTDMTIAEQQRESKQIHNFQDLQESCCTTLSELAKKLEELKTVAGKMQGFDSDLRSEMNRLQADLEASQTKCRSLDAELKAALEKISKLEKELVALKNETANSISSLEAELEASKTKCRSLDAELKAALEKISKLEKELVAFKNETANSISSLKAELVTFHKNIDEIEKELVAHKNEATSLIRSISEESQKKCRSLEAELEQEKSVRQKAERNLTDEKEKCRSLEAELKTSLEKNSKLEKELVAMRADWDKSIFDLTVKSRDLSDAHQEIAELQRKIERGTENIARLTAEIQRLTSELDQEKLVRKKTERDLTDEKEKANNLETAWKKAVVQRDGLQEQLDKMQKDWSRTQAELDAANRMHADLNERIANAERKVTSLNLDKDSLQSTIDELEKRLVQEQETRIGTVRKLEAEIEVLSRERDLLQKERGNLMVRLEELSEEFAKVKATNSVLKTTNEGNAVRIKELELQLKDALQIKCQLQGQVDTLNPEKHELLQRIRSLEMDLQARKDELARTVAENVKLLGQLDAEKAEVIERRAHILRVEEEREKALAEKAKAATECQTLQVELRHCRGNLEGMEQRLAQALVDLQKATDSVAEQTDKSGTLETSERSLREKLARMAAELSELKQAVLLAEAKASEARKFADDMAAKCNDANLKCNDANLKLHEATGREKGVQRELEDATRSLEKEIKHSADKEAALMKEQAYCRSLEKELTDFKMKCCTTENELASVRELDRQHSLKISEQELSFASTRSTMTAEQNKLHQELVLARLAVEQMYKVAEHASSEVEAGRLAAEIEKKNQLAERLAAEKLAKAAAAEEAALADMERLENEKKSDMPLPAVDPRLLARMHQFGYPVDDQDERRKEEASEAELSAARAKKKASRMLRDSEGAQEVHESDAGLVAQQAQAAKNIQHEAQNTAETKLEISEMQTKTCQFVHELTNKLLRLEQQNASVLKQMEEVEELRLRADSLGRDKCIADDEISRLRACCDKGKQELDTLSRTKTRMEAELLTADSKISELNKTLRDSEALHASENLALQNQRARLEGEVSALKRSLAAAESIVAELQLAAQDARQGQAFLTEAIACVCKAQRAILAGVPEGSLMVVAGKGSVPVMTGFGGIGVSVRIENSFCVVKAVDQSESARNSHAMLPHTIRVGHIIESIDGQSVRGLCKNAVQDLLVGPIGSDVTVALRGNQVATLPGDITLFDHSGSAVPKKEVEYVVALKRFAAEESMSSIAERTTQACSRAARYISDIETLKREAASMAAVLLAKEEVIADNIRAREESNRQMLALQERARVDETEKASLSSQIDVLNMQFAACKDQVLDLDRRHETNVEVISFSQRKIFELENTIAALRKEKEGLKNLVDSGVESVKTMKKELKDAQGSYRLELQHMDVEVDKLNAHILANAKSSLRLQDAERREASLKQSLEENLLSYQRDLSSMRDRISELEGLLEDTQDAAGKLTQALQDRAAEVKDARLKARALLDAVKGVAPQWQGVGMVVRSCALGRTPTTISQLRPQGAASRSGVLNEGDILVSVDGNLVSGMEARDIQALILGPPGTTVTLVARPARGSSGGISTRNVSVELVRGDDAKPEEAWDDEVTAAMEAATAVHAQDASIKKVVREIVQEVQRKDADVQLTLETVQNAFNDSRLSSQEVSSSVHSLSFTNHKFDFRQAGEVGAELLDLASLPDIDKLKITSALVEQVRASTARSKLQMSRISSLALESIQQMGDGVKTRQELQRQLSAFEKSKSEQLKSQSEWELMRADYEARARTLKKDNADLSARLADAESEVSLVKNRVSDVLLAAEQARAEATSLRKQKDAMRQELSVSLDALHALHAAIRNQLPSHDGVGMVIRFHGDKCMIKAIVAGGPASQCPQLRVDDILLSVNGQDVRGKAVDQVTKLFVGPPGSAVTLRCAREAHGPSTFDSLTQSPRITFDSLMSLVSPRVSVPANADEKGWFEVELVRGRSPMSARESANEDVKTVQKLHADMARLEQENTDLRKERTDHTQQLEGLSAKLTSARSGHQTELEDLDARLRTAEEERGGTSGVQTQLNNAWEELAIAQATIQALQRRVTELSEDTASPGASNEVGLSMALTEVAQLRARQQTTEDKLRVSEKTLAAARSKISELESLESRFKSSVQQETRPVSTPAKIAKMIPQYARKASDASDTSDSLKATAVGRKGMVGLGLVITDSAPHRITSIVPGGGAHAAGVVREGDIILTVDDTHIEHMDVSGVRALLLGESGSKVDLTLKRAVPQDDESPEYKVCVIRGVQPSVKPLKPRFI